jgi:hypothetical protein
MARAAFAVPTTWIASVFIGIVAARFAHTRTLLSPDGAWGALVLTAMLWVLLYWLLVAAYGSLGQGRVDSVRRLSLRIGIALFLALVSTRLVRIAMRTMLEPLGWGAFYYLRLLVPLSLAVLWCAVLLPQETLAFARGARRKGTIALVLTLVALLLLAVVLVSATDLSFQLVRSGSSVQEQLGAHVIAPRAWAGTTMILFLVLSLAFAATSSAIAAVLLVSPLYAAMVFATVMKFRYIHAAVHPYDLLTLPEFMPLFGSFFGLGAIVDRRDGACMATDADVHVARQPRCDWSCLDRAARRVHRCVLAVGSPPRGNRGPQ